MQAIILAAGMGKRLGELTQKDTKCMVDVNEEKLIDRMLRQLSSLNLNKIIIVTGFGKNNLQKHIKTSYKGSIKIEYVDNPIYNKTNNIYSLYLAKDKLVQDDTILLESDLIFADTVLPSIAESKDQDLAVVAKYEPWMDGTMVTLDEQHNIISFVPKKLFNYDKKDSYYKTVNIYKFSKEFSQNRYVPFLEAYSKAYGNNEYYEQVLRVLSMMDKNGLKGLVLTDEKWYEIDDVQDLDIAETIFVEEKSKLSKIQGRYGGYWRFNDLIDFCYLVNPYFPTPQMLNEIKSNFDILLRNYPSGLKVNNLLASKYFKVDKDYICIGNGAAELIKILMENTQGVMGIVLPTFEEYPNRAEENSIISFIPNNSAFSYNVDDLITFFDGKNISNLLLINPDNPSGNYISKKDIIRLIAWTKDKNINLIIDESFIDFSEEQVTLFNNQILAENPHLVVVKSISKSYGVPGLRLGVVASSNEEILETIRKEVAIWNINSFAEYYMQIYGKYESDYKEACLLFIKERERFKIELQRIEWLKTIPSQANYFLCEILNDYISSTNLAEKLLGSSNILIKDCGTKKAFEKGNYIRIAIRGTEDNDKLIKALKLM